MVITRRFESEFHRNLHCTVFECLSKYFERKVRFQAVLDSLSEGEAPPKLEGDYVVWPSGLRCDLFGDDEL